MKVLIFSDLHIDERNLEECECILNEILNIAKEHNVNSLWNLGDTFDKYNPPSKCMDIYANFVKSWNKEIINVVASSHESTQIGHSILNHYAILEPKYVIRSEEMEVCEGKYLLGHYMVNESLYGYNVKRNIKTLRKYKYAFLGHQHSLQYMGNVIHAGSCRYVSFSEYNDVKQVLILDLETDKISHIHLQSPVPMIVYGCNKNNANNMYEAINDLHCRHKVKLIFNDLWSYKFLINEISRWGSKFVDFKIELNFQIKQVKSDLKTFGDFTPALYKYLAENNIDEEVKLILKKEVENA